MDRKEFLSQIGFTGATFVFAQCLGGCSKSDGSTNNNGGTNPPTKVNFTLDLTNSAYAPLLTAGGYIYKDGVIVARTLANQYIAVSAACPHQGTSVVFEGSNNRFFCPNHGSTFSTSGAVTAGPANSSLIQYNTELTGNLLRVFS